MQTYWFQKDWSYVYFTRISNSNLMRELIHYNVPIRLEIWIRVIPNIMFVNSRLKLKQSEAMCSNCHWNGILAIVFV